jgi:GGDEF domain-containing protein
MVIYRGSVARTDLNNLSNALVAAGQQPIDLSDGNIAHIGLSVGIAVAPQDGTTADLLVTRSDTALYDSKKQGRNRFSFYADIAKDDEDDTLPPRATALQ